ncbi:MAG: sugar kinase [Terracoccus sp.]
MTAPCASVDVVTLGETMLLLLATDGLPSSQAPMFSATIAGAEANVACGVARLGHAVTIFGRVGTDPSGQRVRARLRGEGVDTTHIVTDPQRATGLLLRDAPAGRPVTVEYHRTGSAGAALHPDDIDLKVLARSRILHVTGVTAALSDTAFAAVDVAMDTARERGVHVSFDPNVRLRLADVQTWCDLTARLLPKADTVLIGDAEMLALGIADPHAVLDAGPSIVVVKRGADGADATDRTRSWHQPARRVPVVDPVGAGDAFAAGWLSAHLDELPIPDRLERACAVASFVVATRGDIEGLPTHNELDELGPAGADVLR